MVKLLVVKVLDWFFLVLSLTLTVGTAWAVLTPTEAPLRVEVEDSSGTAIYPLNEDRHIEAKGPLGVTEIYIAQGKAWVHDSPCTNKVCIAMGVIHNSGQFVACLPNKVFVRITGGAANTEAPDASVW
jgi:hypothetical protein